MPPDAPAASERRLLSIDEARVRVRVSRRTIYNWMHAGKVDYVRTAGGCVRIYADSLFRGPRGEPLPPR